MKISYSELILLGNPVLQNVDRLIALGCDRVELLMDGEPWDDSYGRWNDLANELVKRKVIYSVHPAAWDSNLTCENRVIREAVLNMNKQALDFAAKIGAHQMVLHPGFLSSPAFSKQTAARRAMEATWELAAYAKPLGVKLAFENVGYHGHSIYTMEEFASALDGVDDTVGYLIDTGHANINGWNIPRLIRHLSGRLDGIHLHDNDGTGDAHLPLYKGNIDWEPVFAAIRDTCPDCELILEYAPGTPLEELSEGHRLLAAGVNYQ